MLKITLAQEAEPTTLKLEGKLTGPWVGELKRVWKDITATQEPQSVLVDLSDVHFIDSEGKKLLAWMLGQGAELGSNTLLTQFILHRIRHESNGNHASNNGG